MRLPVLMVLGLCILSNHVVCQSSTEDDPPTVLWRGIKQELSGPHGREFFDKSIKDALLPPLRGVLVSSTPADHPTEFLVAMAGNPHPEVTLKLYSYGRQKPLAPGAPIRFDGVGEAFSQEPFMLTLRVEMVRPGSER
jgi:hypothetical protein